MKKILGILLVMTLVLTACGAKDPQPETDPVADGDQSTEETSVQWFENGTDTILINAGVVSFDLEDQYFDAAAQPGEEYITVVYNGKGYAAMKVDGDKLLVYDVPEEGKELDESTVVEYTAIERDYITKDVNGSDLSAIKKVFDEESKVVKAKKAISDDDETFIVTIQNRETEEISEVTLDTEFNVK